MFTWKVTLLYNSTNLLTTLPWHSIVDFLLPITLKDQGPLPKMLNSPADGTPAGGLECLQGPSAWLVNKFSTRGGTRLEQPSGKETLMPSSGQFNIFGSWPSFFQRRPFPINFSQWFVLFGSTTLPSTLPNMDFPLTFLTLWFLIMAVTKVKKKTFHVRALVPKT